MGDQREDKNIIIGRVINVTGMIGVLVLRIARPRRAIEDTTVVDPRYAARLIRQHWLDGCPLTVGEFVAHESSLA